MEKKTSSYWIGMVELLKMKTRVQDELEITIKSNKRGGSLGLTDEVSKMHKQCLEQMLWSLSNHFADVHKMPKEGGI
ncbi:MAG TPA: hypothetical protein VHT73_17820 [Thermodesulfobacteriota bacterium]|nr:hypothetical protein [Thermodesulfobacteriota bacterium]